jgi:hypothetical protein
MWLFSLYCPHCLVLQLPGRMEDTGEAGRTHLSFVEGSSKSRLRARLGDPRQDMESRLKANTELEGDAGGRTSVNTTQHTQTTPQGQGPSR